MKTKFTITGMIMLILTGIIFSCDPSPTAQPPTTRSSVPASTGLDPSVTLPVETIDLNTYQATTPEAAAVINLFKQGRTVQTRSINGGVTDEALQKYRAERLSMTQDGTPAGRRVNSRPTSPATRPKITWVGRDGGPGETYLINQESSSGTTEPYRLDGYKLMSYSEKSWLNNDFKDYNDFRYVTALFQTPEVSANDHYFLPFYATYRAFYWHYDTIDLNTRDFDRKENSYTGLFQYTRVTLGNLTNEYDYFDIPAAVFQDTTSYPYQETWYWNPPWHFQKVAMYVSPAGEVTYAATTQEGYENQFFVYRWSVDDFRAAYESAAGWHEQGWYIKDIDVEEGSVTAILYAPASPYSEVLFVNIPDNLFSRFVEIMWSAGYRGLMIDSSW
jgi:hypothetical protein